jgi:aspartate racemase
MKQKTIGILGGMGPASSAYFAQKLIALNTAAKRDEDHAAFVLYSDPGVPSRVNAFLKKTASPAPSIVASLDRLASFGADFGVIVCNTAHLYFDEISGKTRLPLINMVQNTAEHVLRTGYATKVGLLATTATVRARLYQRYFRASGIEIVAPSDQDQELVSMAIFDPLYGIKSTQTTISDQAAKTVAGVAGRMRQQAGITHLLLGCTELSLLVSAKSWAGFEIIDPIEILAERCLHEAKGADRHSDRAAFPVFNNASNE